VSKRKRVAFARINRRSEDDSLFEARPFQEDMRALAESRETRAHFRGNEWIAADLEILPNEDYMIGILGFSDEETFRDLDPAAFSWLKGPTTIIAGASAERTMVPFAVDLHENGRWVAFGTSLRIQPAGFAAGFRACLNAAVGSLGLTPSEWDVDLVLGKARVEEWLEAHPNVTKFTRVIRLHNPSVRLDQDRERMRALAARRLTETYSVAPARKHHLKIRENPEFDNLLDGLDTGDLDIQLEARAGSYRVTFSSRAMADRRWVDDYGENLEYGMEVMLVAVQEYANDVAGGQGGFF
jgi:hypothetical protein